MVGSRGGGGQTVIGVGRADIEAAAERIGGHVRRTPVLRLEAGALGIDPGPASLSLKLELFQHTGSFKPRGAFSRILAAEVPEAGVITASGGNHGQAVAHVARQLGLRAEIFVPSGSPPLKAERIRASGAEV
ncbi:MAG TPA: pyridoxal-phosphate dependent enzyme, partial [Acidobacteriota bacterium]